MKRNNLLFQLAVSGRGIEEIESGLLPIPMASEAGKSEHTLNLVIEGKSQMTLDRYVKIVKMFPTPREFMYKDSKKDRGKCNLGEVIGGQLNPTWVEWLMGYPEGWTDLKDYEMP